MWEQRASQSVSCLFSTENMISNSDLMMSPDSGRPKMNETGRRETEWSKNNFHTRIP